MPPKGKAQPPALAKDPFWKRSHKTLYGSIVVATLSITLLEGYPWLSIQENAFLDPLDPYSQMFSITNQGYIPLTDVDVNCLPSYTTSANVEFRNIAFPFHGVADYLGHAGTVTIPCFQIADVVKIVGNKLPNATLEIVVTYALYHANVKPLRRSQRFHFRSVIARDQSQHWEFRP